MVTEDHEIPSGWPLGLEIMNMRIRSRQNLQTSVQLRSASFSSFSSSNLDTESTASFFQDHSVSLGRLIGIKAGEGEGLYFPNSINFREGDRRPVRGACSDVSRGRSVDMTQGICIPLILGVLVKMSRSKSKSKT